MTPEAKRARTDVSVEKLIAASLEHWGIEGQLARNGEGVLVVRTAAVEVKIVRAPADLPFRWIVDVGGRERGAASVVGVLRQVRGALDSEFKPARLRIAALPEAT